MIELMKWGWMLWSSRAKSGRICYVQACPGTWLKNDKYPRVYIILEMRVGYEYQLLRRKVKRPTTFLAPWLLLLACLQQLYKHRSSEVLNKYNHSYKNVEAFLMFQTQVCTLYLFYLLCTGFEILTRLLNLLWLSPRKFRKLLIGLVSFTFAY